MNDLIIDLEERIQDDIYLRVKEIEHKYNVEIPMTLVFIILSGICVKQLRGENYVVSEDRKVHDIVLDLYNSSQSRCKGNYTDDLTGVYGYIGLICKEFLEKKGNWES